MWCTEQMKWPLLVETVSQSAANLSCLPPGVQLMLIGVKLSTLLVAVVIRNGKSLVITGLQHAHLDFNPLMGSGIR